MRNTVLFPGMVLPLGVGRERSVAAAQEAVREQRPSLRALLQLVDAWASISVPPRRRLRRSAQTRTRHRRMSRG